MSLRNLMLALLPFGIACVFSVNRNLGPGELRGHVVFALSSGAQSPAAGAHVVLSNTSLSTNADANGTFTFGDLPPGTYSITITASQSGGAVDSGLRLSGLVLAPLGSGAADGLDLGTLVLAPFGSIAGSVTLNNAPITGAIVVLTGLAQTASTDGTFAFPNLAAGTYSLAAIFQSGSNTSVSSQVDVVVSPRQPAQAALVLTPASLGSLAGQLDVASGGSVLNAQIQPFTLGIAIPEVQPGEAGDYSVPSLPPGLYAVTASETGYASVQVSFLVVGDITTQVPTITLIPGPRGTEDAGLVDAGLVDAGTIDAGLVDAGLVDAGLVDGGLVDAGLVDAGAVDSGLVDAGLVDAGAVDAGAVDSGPVDSGPVDSGPGLVDAGPPDSGCNFSIVGAGSAQVWVATYAGNGLQGDTSLGNTIDGTASPSGTAQIAYPTAITLDTSGDLYFTEYYAARKIDTCGNVTTLYSNNENTTDQADIDLPGGIGVTAAGVAWVASPDGIVGSSSEPGAFTIAARTQGEEGTGFQEPAGLAVTPEGTVYFSDSYTNDVWMLSGNAVTLFAGPMSTDNGLHGLSGQVDGQGTQARFNAPTGMVIDSLGNLYVADSGNNAIRMIDSKGKVTTVAGAGPSGFADGTGGMTGTARFSNPTGVAVDALGNIFVADTGNDAIRWIDSSGNVTTVVAGAGGGYLDGPAGKAQFSVGTGVAVDSHDNIYFTDVANGRIRVIFLPTGYLTQAGGSDAGLDSGTDAGSPTIGSGVNVMPIPNGLTFQTAGITIDSQGNIYAGDQVCGAILKVAPDGGTTALTGVEGPSCTSGFANGSGSSVKFDVPWGVALDSTGDVIVADSGNHLIRKIDTAGNVTTVAGSKAPGFMDATGTAAEFDGPWGIAIDNTDTLYVADSQNNRIRAVNLSTGAVTTVAGSGPQGYADGPALSAMFNHPAAVAVDNEGDVFIVDMGNSRIRKLSGNAVSTIAGNGTAGYVDGTGGASGTAEFNLPVSIGVDGSGRLYVGDPNNGAVRQIDTSGNVTTLMEGTIPGETFAATWPIAVTAQGVFNGFQLITCTTTTCGAYCMDLNGDPLHCGSCSNACSGVAVICNAGTCESVTTLTPMLSGVSEIVVEDPNLYWVDESNDLESVSTGGGSPTTLASGFRNIAADSTNVYGDDGASIYLLEEGLDGGNPTTLDPSGNYDAYDLVEAGADLYFTTGNSVASVPIAGGAQMTLTSSLSQASSDLDFDYALAADTKNLYWADTVGRTEVSLVSLPLAGGSVSTLVTGLPYATVNDLAVSGGVLYATVTASGDPPQGAVIQVSTSGGPATTLASGPWNPMTLVTDGVSVYWFNYTTNAIVKMRITGGVASTMVSARLSPFAQASGLGKAFAVDASNIYWENDPYGSRMLMSAAK